MNDLHPRIAYKETKLERIELVKKELRDAIAKVDGSQEHYDHYRRGIERLQMQQFKLEPMASYFNNLKNSFAYEESMNDQTLYLRTQLTEVREEKIKLQHGNEIKDNLIQELQTEIQQKQKGMEVASETEEVLRRRLEEFADDNTQMAAFIAYRKGMDQAVFDKVFRYVAPAQNELGLAQRFAIKIRAGESVDYRHAFDAMLPYAHESRYINSSISHAATRLLRDYKSGCRVLSAILKSTSLPAWAPPIPVHFHPQSAEMLVQLYRRKFIPRPQHLTEGGSNECWFDLIMADGVVNDSIEYALVVKINETKLPLYKIAGNIIWRGMDGWCELSMAELSESDGRCVVRGVEYHIDMFLLI